MKLYNKKSSMSIQYFSGRRLTYALCECPERPFQDQDKDRVQPHQAAAYLFRHWCGYRRSDLPFDPAGHRHNTGALFAMLAIMPPAFLLAMYEKDGLPFEKVICNIVRVKFTRPGIRPYRTENIYAPFARKEEPIEQSKKAEKRK